MSDELFETGLRIRKEVLGEEYVERSLANAGGFSKDFQRLVTEYCWGAGWGRPALSKRDRSLLKITASMVLEPKLLQCSAEHAANLPLRSAHRLRGTHPAGTSGLTLSIRRSNTR